ncbi:ATP-dependent helicase HrpB [Bombella sp. TMW 2.2559]|uniref:ATP-dependent helicase HrpB n=1 Tax=Bombella dulcis TaxID=2967339 RepID=A0ABT3WAM1_9PROT|nr:ATP-dependent helicase HrpB [Bombella dulcis]MCX5616146.1 ATP-dependent helicase HrpB [Bombella dulcis]
MTVESLPVTVVLPVLHEALATGPNAVLVAPPGAGKTTAVPLSLLEAAPDWLGNGRILLVEPRRVAVRAAAQRMAALRGEKPGGVIGYRTRIDSAVSARTRIEVVTEGLLVRRLLADPLLEGVSAVLFDEVHERSLDGDTALGFCRDVQQSLRPELRLVAMSATLDAGIFTTALKAPLIESDGRQYPVEVRYRRDIAHLRDLPESCAQALAQAWREENGSILAFLPGVGEIRRAQASLQALLGEQAPIYPLYGEQSVEDQARALDHASGRRIVLATSIAETSVTVPGVRVVVDGGWRRLPQRDASTGLPRLHTRRISRATAEQRAGRAGRQMPGIAIRLWSEMTQRSLIVQEVPAIREADLCDFALVTAAWKQAMGTAPAALPLIEPAPEGGLAAAQALLQLLGALDSQQGLTALGRRMVGFGTHPRLAAMLCAARIEEELAVAACLAALLEERDPLGGRGGKGGEASADLRLRLKLFMQDDARVPRHVVRQLRRAAVRFLRRAGQAVQQDDLADLMSEGLAGYSAGMLVAAGFPDRLAQRTSADGRYRLAGGGSARIGATDPLVQEGLLAGAAFHIRKGTDMTLAAPVTLETLPDSVQASLTEQREPALDGTSGKVIVRQRLRLGNLVLKDRNVPAEPEDVTAALLAKVQSDLPRHLDWSVPARQLQARVALARTHYALHLPDMSDEALARNMDWLEPWLAGLDRLAQLRELDVAAILASLLSYEDRQELDRQLPTHVTLKVGRRRIDYTTVVPSLSARAQDFYGTTALPKLAGGRVPLHATLLSPAGRPQAVTADLEQFWTSGWLDMRRDMRGRYPRHKWPENPASEA